VTTFLLDIAFDRANLDSANKWLLMKIWINHRIENRRHCVDKAGNRIRIGRNPDNDIVLDSPFIAGEEQILYRRGTTWELLQLGINGCQIGDKDVRSGERFPLERSELIKVFPFTLELDLPNLDGASAEARRRQLDERMAQFLLGVHLELLTRMNLDVVGESQQDSDDYLFALENNLHEIARMRGLQKPRNADLVGHMAAHCVRGELLHQLLQASHQAASELITDGGWSRLVTAVPDRENELSNALQVLSNQLDLNNQPTLTQRIEAVETEFWSKWDEVQVEVFPEFREYLASRYLKKQIKDVVFGYGPLEDLLRIPTINEIMVVSRDHIYVERNGVLENSGRQFISDTVTQSIIERIVAKVGRRIDKSQPLVDARLTDGSRVNAVIAPIAVSGPCLTIRKFPQRTLLVDDLVAKGALTRTVAEFLRAVTIARKNIIVSGGTGTGKTTLLNCLSDFIPDKDRIVTIEDTAELRLKKEHVVSLESKKANIEGAGAYTIRDLVINALRMRPDRIIVGECRGPEAIDMLQAMNTGHDGSMTTLHANSAEDVILRLEVLVQMASDLPNESVHRQIASAVDLIVQLHRLRDGRRVVAEVTEVVGFDLESGKVRLKQIFVREEEPLPGQLAATGRLPTFIDEVISAELISIDSFYL
jgi:Flp pilus assembly CpaF family ATPase